MIINFFYNPDDVISFFKTNGFEIIELPVGHYNKANKWVETNEPAVISQGRAVKAELLFSKLCERFISTMLRDKGAVIKAAILTEFNEIINDKS